MTPASDRAYIWGWLPGQTDPVAIGTVRDRNGLVEFAYGRAYLERADAISLWTPELPLRAGWQRPDNSMGIASVLRDSSPDAWGRRVIVDQQLGREALLQGEELGELDYLRLASSNRIGALDVQDTPFNYVDRSVTTGLASAEKAAVLLDADAPIPPEVRKALGSGTGVGGARPKALLTLDGREVLAKFSLTDDSPQRPPVQAEAAALFLARKAGLEVTDSTLLRVNQRYALIVDRFDRPGDGARRMVLSGLTITGLDEMLSHYGTYPDLVTSLRARSHDPEAVGPAIFERIAYNMAITNTDDHPHNHAAFWDGHNLELTPAYDLTPGGRSGDTATLVLPYNTDGAKQMSFAGLVDSAHLYGLDYADARDVIERISETIHENWNDAADHAHLTRAQSASLYGTQFLHISTRYGYNPEVLDMSTNTTTGGPDTIRCRFCNRPLMSAETQARGYGKICAEKNGLPFP